MQVYRIIVGQGTSLIDVTNQVMNEVNEAFGEGWKLYGDLIVKIQFPTDDYPEPYYDVFREMIRAPETTEFRRE